MNADLLIHRRKNYMFADIELIINGQLIDCAFMTPAFIENAYKEICQRDLQLDLKTTSTDLFDIIEDMFPNTILVVREGILRGFLRRNSIDGRFTLLPEKPFILPCRHERDKLSRTESMTSVKIHSVDTEKEDHFTNVPTTILKPNIIPLPCEKSCSVKDESISEFLADSGKTTLESKQNIDDGAKSTPAKINTCSNSDDLLDFGLVREPKSHSKCPEENLQQLSNEKVDPGLLKFYKVKDSRIMNYEEVYHNKVHQAEIAIKNLKLSTHVMQSAGIISNVQTVFKSLSKIIEMFPDGFNVKQFSDWNNGQTSTDRLKKISCLVTCGLLTTADEKIYKVAEEVLTAKFIYLRRNFCSNSYRLIYRCGGIMSIKTVLKYADKLTPENAKISAENIVSLCNRYPLLFSLISSEQINYDVEDSTIELNKRVLDWLVVLDCDSSKVEGEICDCTDCC